MDIFTSKKFRVALTGLIVVIAEHYIPGLTGLPVQDILMIVVAYVIGQGIADIGKEREIARQGGKLLEDDQQ